MAVTSSDQPSQHTCLATWSLEVPLYVAGAEQGWCGCCPLCWPPTLTSCLRPRTKLRPIGSLRVLCLDGWSRATVSRMLLCTHPQVLLDLFAFSVRRSVNKESTLLMKLINLGSPCSSVILFSGANLSCAIATASTLMTTSAARVLVQCPLLKPLKALLYTPTITFWSMRFAAPLPASLAIMHSCVEASLPSKHASCLPLLRHMRCHRQPS